MPITCSQQLPLENTSYTDYLRLGCAALVHSDSLPIQSLKSTVGHAEIVCINSFLFDIIYDVWCQIGWNFGIKQPVQNISAKYVIDRP